MTTFNTMQAIRVRFLRPTNTKGCRLVCDNTNRDRMVVLFEWDTDVDEQTFKLAQAFVKKFHEHAPELYPIGGAFRNDTYYTFTERS